MKKQIALHDLLVTLELERLRHETVKFFRQRVDEASERHRLAKRIVELLERRAARASAAQQPNAAALELARKDRDAARLELTKARRACSERSAL